MGERGGRREPREWRTILYNPDRGVVLLGGDRGQDKVGGEKKKGEDKIRGG